MIKKREIIIAITCFLIGTGTMYFYGQSITKNKLADNNQITFKIIDNCMAAFKASDALINNCSEAYSEVAICFSDSNNCDFDESAYKLRELNYEKEKIQAELKKVIKQIDEIITMKMSM